MQQSSRRRALTVQSLSVRRVTVAGSIYTPTTTASSGAFATSLSVNTIKINDYAPKTSLLAQRCLFGERK